jgi:hypothetical protein
MAAQQQRKEKAVVGEQQPRTDNARLRQEDAAVKELRAELLQLFSGRSAAVSRRWSLRGWRLAALRGPAAVAYHSWRCCTTRPYRLWTLAATAVAIIGTSWAQAYALRPNKHAYAAAAAYSLGAIVGLSVLQRIGRGKCGVAQCGEGILLVLLLVLPTVVEAIAGIPLLLGGGLLASIAFALLGSSLSLQRAEVLTAAGAVLYAVRTLATHWGSSSDHLPWPDLCLALGALAVLFLLALRVASATECVLRQDYRATVAISAAQAATKSEAALSDGIVAAQLPAAAVQALAARRAAESAVCSSQRRSSSSSTPLPAAAEAEQSETSMVALTRLAAPSYREVDRRLVTVAAARVSGCAALVCDAAQSHAGAASLLAALFGELNVCAARLGMSRLSSLGGTAYVACVGLPSSHGGAVADAEAALLFACDAAAVGAALGLGVCVGVASGSAVGGGITLSPLTYSLIGQVAASATSLAHVDCSCEVSLIKYIITSTHCCCSGSAICLCTVACRSSTMRNAAIAAVR